MPKAKDLEISVVGAVGRALEGLPSLEAKARVLAYHTSRLQESRGEQLNQMLRDASQLNVAMSRQPANFRDAAGEDKVPVDLNAGRPDRIS
jgi:hypothetical protein